MKVEPKKIGENSFFSVELSQLERGSLLIDRDIPLDWIQKRMTFCEYEARPDNAHVSLTIAQMSTGVLVRGNVTAKIRAQCGLCLKDISLDLRSEIVTYLVPASEMARERADRELTPEDLDREYYNDDIITLDELIGDAMMLEMPMNPKCGDKCPGYRAVSMDETPRGIDPRLAPLAGIRINKEN